MKAKVARTIIDARHHEFYQLSRDEVNQKIDEIVRQHHSVMRESKAVCEFSATVKSFPNRSTFPSLSEKAVNAEIKLGASIAIQLDDYYNVRSSKSLEIRLDELHTIELWVPRDKYNSINPNLKFPDNPHTRLEKIGGDIPKMRTRYQRAHSSRASHCICHGQLQ